MLALCGRWDLADVSWARRSGRGSPVAISCESSSVYPALRPVPSSRNSVWLRSRLGVRLWSTTVTVQPGVQFHVPRFPAAAAREPRDRGLREPCAQDPCCAPWGRRAARGRRAGPLRLASAQTHECRGWSSEWGARWLRSRCSDGQGENERLAYGVPFICFQGFPNCGNRR